MPRGAHESTRLRVGSQWGGGTFADPGAAAASEGRPPPPANTLLPSQPSGSLGHQGPGEGWGWGAGLLSWWSLHWGEVEPPCTVPPPPTDPLIEPLTARSSALHPFLPWGPLGAVGVNPPASCVPSKSASLREAVPVCSALHLSHTLRDPESHHM